MGVSLMGCHSLERTTYLAGVGLCELPPWKWTVGPSCWQCLLCLRRFSVQLLCKGMGSCRRFARCISRGRMITGDCDVTR